MAIQTDIRPHPGRFAGLPNASDRAKAFRQAKRHSAMVRLLRRILPLIAVAVAGLYFLPSFLTVKTKTGEASVESIDVTGGGLKMVNPRFKGVNEKYGVYNVRAEYGTQHVDNPELITLNKITGDIVGKTGETTTLEAPTGIYQSKEQELTFDNGALIGGTAGYRGKLKTATAFMQENKIVSKDPVDLAFHNSTIKADTMTLYSSESRAIFEGRVKVHLEKAPEGGAQ
jgi:lipopolysaccharide export system protein LptC